MASQAQYAALARTLPQRLTRFFARYAPPATAQMRIQESSANTAPGPLPLTLDTSLADSDTITAASSTVIEQSYENPFRSTKHPTTGRWHDPKFSLRRQAELVKLAREHGVEELLPFTVKKTEERLRRREENGLRVKGTGIGQKVKGKEWERTMKGRLEKRKQAMLQMPQMIQTWKERGHGRGWKKWPK